MLLNSTQTLKSPLLSIKPRSEGLEKKDASSPPGGELNGAFTGIKVSFTYILDFLLKIVKWGCLHSKRIVLTFKFKPFQKSKLEV